MDKLDRLVWTDGVCFEAYGLRVGIRVNDSQVLKDIGANLPPTAKVIEGPFVDYLLSLRVGKTRANPKIRPYHLLYAGLRRAARTQSMEQLFQTLEDDITLYLAEWAKDRVIVHAGVVGWQGNAIVLPGKSFSGKSTLVAALLRAGADYYSDDQAVIDSEGFVHPCPRPLMMRNQQGQFDRRSTPEDFGSQSATAPLPIKVIAQLQYRPQGRWKPCQLSPGRTLADVVPYTFTMLRRPKACLQTLERVVKNAYCLKGTRGEATKTAHELLQIL